MGGAKGFFGRPARFGGGGAHSEESHDDNRCELGPCAHVGPFRPTDTRGSRLSRARARFSVGADGVHAKADWRLCKCGRQHGAATPPREVIMTCARSAFSLL